MALFYGLPRKYRAQREPFVREHVFVLDGRIILAVKYTVEEKYDDDVETEQEEDEGAMEKEDMLNSFAYAASKVLRKLQFDKNFFKGANDKVEDEKSKAPKIIKMDLHSATAPHPRPKPRRQRANRTSSRRDTMLQQARKTLKFLKGASAARTLHPAWKPRLHGLMIQMLQGDWKEDDVLQKQRAGQDPATPTGLARAAWKNEHGKSRRACASEIAKLLDEVHPQWTSSAALARANSASTTIEFRLQITISTGSGLPIHALLIKPSPSLAVPSIKGSSFTSSTFMKESDTMLQTIGQSDESAFTTTSLAVNSKGEAIGSFKQLELVASGDPWVSSEPRRNPKSQKETHKDTSCARTRRCAPPRSHGTVTSKISARASSLGILLPFLTCMARTWTRTKPICSRKWSR